MRRRRKVVEALLGTLVAVALGGCVTAAQPDDQSGTSGGSGNGTQTADEPAGNAGGSGGSGSDVTDEGKGPVDTVGPRLPGGSTPTAGPRPAGPATTGATRPPVTSAPATVPRPTTTVASSPATLAAPGQAGGSGGSSPSDDTANEPSGSAGGSSALDPPAPPARPPGTRTPPSPDEVRALEQQIPKGPFAAAYVAITSLPPFVLIACLEGLTYALGDVPPEQRYPDPFVPGSPMEVARSYCSRFELEPLRTRTLSSGGSSRAVEPADVQVEVEVPGPDRIIVREVLRPEVREQLRPGVRSSSRQLFATTLAMLLAVVVLVATAAVAFGRRRR